MNNSIWFVLLRWWPISMIGIYIHKIGLPYDAPQFWILMSCILVYQIIGTVLGYLARVKWERDSLLMAYKLAETNKPDMNPPV